MRKRTLLSLITLLLFSIFIVACAADEDEGVIEDEAPLVEEDEGVLEEDEGVLEEDEGVVDGITPLADITADPEAFVDQPVVVEEEIGTVVDRFGFTVGDDDVLVASTDPAGFDETVLTPGTFVTVPGTVGTFDRAAFEEEFGVDLEDEPFDPFVGRPFIEADPAGIETLE